MTEKKSLIHIERLENSILLIRGQRVMLGNDLAVLFGVKTRRLNEQIRRNIVRFPEDFMFQLTKEEKYEVVANCDHLSNLKHGQALPYAFTEHGVVMLANVLNSPQAVQSSIQVVRAFIRIRQMFTAHEDIARKLDALEKKYDAQFRVVFDAIRQLMAPPKPKKNQIGFHWEAQETPVKKAPAKKKSTAKERAPSKKKTPAKQKATAEKKK